jgi:Cu/Ag efflux protein CusF
VNRLISRRTLALVLAAASTGGGAMGQEQLSQFVDGVGVVLAANPGARQLKVDHQEIKGFMHAMQMEYPVARQALLRGVRPGDKVRFTIRRRNGTIERLKVTERARE